jgi:hypothetical protein
MRFGDQHGTKIIHHRTGEDADHRKQVRESSAGVRRSCARLRKLVGTTPEERIVVVGRAAEYSSRSLLDAPKTSPASIPPAAPVSRSGREVPPTLPSVWRGAGAFLARLDHRLLRDRGARDPAECT